MCDSDLERVSDWRPGLKVLLPWIRLSVGRQALLDQVPALADAVGNPARAHSG